MRHRGYTWNDVQVPRPATGKTPGHNIRVPWDVWNAAKAKARAEGRTLASVINAYLLRYISASPRKRDGGE